MPSMPVYPHVPASLYRFHLVAQRRVGWSSAAAALGSALRGHASASGRWRRRWLVVGGSGVVVIGDYIREYYVYTYTAYRSCVNVNNLEVHTYITHSIYSIYPQLSQLVRPEPGAGGKIQSRSKGRGQQICAFYVCSSIYIYVYTRGLLTPGLRINPSNNYYYCLSYIDIARRQLISSLGCSVRPYV